MSVALMTIMDPDLEANAWRPVGHGVMGGLSPGGISQFEFPGARPGAADDQ